MAEYDEAADLLEHKKKVEALRGWVEYLGLVRKKFELGVDIGAGLGGHAPWLLELVDKLYVTDVINFNAIDNGNFTRLFKEKYIRNGVDCDLAKLEFHNVDAQNLVYRDGIFDFVFSVNAFEHIPEPKLAFDEIVRVTRPGALVVLQFDPIWYSAFGNHLWHLNPDPWAHLLLSQEEFENDVRARGGTEQDIVNVRQDMNRKPFSVYRDLFESPPSHLFSESYFTYWSKSKDEDPYASHENFQKCVDQGFDPELLLVRGIQFAGIRA